MYAESVIAATVAKLEAHYRPPKLLRVYTPAEVDEWIARLSDAAEVSEKGEIKGIRQLDGEEQAFIINELILTKASYEYWCERYCYINFEGTALARLWPLWDSQKLVLAKVAELEELVHAGEHGHGILCDCLKARQEGVSTLAESLIGHRIITQTHLQGVIASDVPGAEGSGYLFGMVEKIVDNLPFFLRPSVTDRVKETEIAFDTGTHLWVGAGKSMKGGEQKRGQLGRGKTISIFHLSELSTWDNPDQLDDSFFPTVPLNNPRVLGLNESTAKGRNDWWHKHWKKAVAGVSRFTPIFIPWYAEPSKYRLKPPEGWEPSADTLHHAARARENGPKWVGKPVRLAKEQLFWYERTKAEFAADDNLSKFLEEYPADPEEAFQYSGKSVFPVKVIERIRTGHRPFAAVLDVGPLRDML